MRDLVRHCSILLTGLKGDMTEYTVEGRLAQALGFGVAV